MTCPAVLRATFRYSIWEKQILVSCKKPDKAPGVPHKGKNHEPDLSQLPLSFGGTAGVWTAKIRV